MITSIIVVGFGVLTGYFAYKQYKTANRLSDLLIKHETVLKYVESLETQHKPQVVSKAKKKPTTKSAEPVPVQRGRKPRSK